MVYSYQVIVFNTISLVNATYWSQSVTEKGVMYKATHDPFSKLIIQSSNNTKKVFRVPKNRTVIVEGNIAHFVGELS